MKTEFYGATTINGNIALLHFMAGSEDYAGLGQFRELSAYCPVCDIDFEIYATSKVDKSSSIHCPHCGHHLNLMEIIK